MKTFTSPRTRARVGEFLDALGHALAAELEATLDRGLQANVGPVEDLQGAQIHAILPDPTLGWSVQIDGLPEPLWCMLRRAEAPVPAPAALAAASARAALRLLRPNGRGRRNALADAPTELDAGARHDRFPARAAYLGRRLWIRVPDDVGLELLVYLPVGAAEPLTRIWVTAPPDFRDSPVRSPGVAAGTLHRFVHVRGVAELVDHAAAMAGLTIRAHGPGDAPNPGAISDGVVVLDVPVGQERRIEWCARLKQRRPRLAVVMLMHHPSRARVLRGLVARPDVLLGLPVDEAELVDRLCGLVSVPR